MNMNHYNLVGPSFSTNSFPSRNIHVLLVEHESRDHENIVNLLHHFSYQVSSVPLVSMALSILSKGKVEFDLVMANMDSQDSLGLIQLLHDATKMKLLVIFMSNVEDDVTSMRALEEGACLCVRKPLSMAIVASLWQLVLREKAKHQTQDPFAQLIDYRNNSEFGFENYNVLESNKNNINFEGNVNNFENNYRCRYRRKAWTEWTVELHQKFMAAAKYLGQGRCYPKDILELMNVPGLTRMQVASHLQKCRNANWLPPNERKFKGAGIDGETIPKRVKKAPRAKTVKFGLMPFWDKEHSEFHQTIHEYHNDINLHTGFDHNDINLLTGFGYDDRAAESSNSRYLDYGLHPFGPDLDHGLHPFGPDLDHGLLPDFGLENDINNPFFYNDCQTHDDFDSLTDILPNFSNKDPFEQSLAIMDPNMVPAHDFPDFQKELDHMDFDRDWESFIQDVEKQHDNQVSAVAPANNQYWFDEAFNFSMEKEEFTEQGQTKNGL